MADNDFFSSAPDPSKIESVEGLYAVVYGTSLEGRAQRTVRVNISRTYGCEVSVSWGRWNCKIVRVSTDDLRKLAAWTLQALDAWEQHEATKQA